MKSPTRDGPALFFLLATFALTLTQTVGPGAAPAPVVRIVAPPITPAAHRKVTSQ